QGAAGTVAASMVKGERVSKRFSRQAMTELNRLNEEETRSDALLRAFLCQASLLCLLPFRLLAAGGALHGD
uniref:hypothetical protein n=1 Tax=Escherichia coli TaxID=562 RepID=UPI002FEEFD4F